MANYFYLTFLFASGVYVIFDSIYSFYKGTYNPYIFFGKETNKKRILNAGLCFAIYWAFYNLLINTKPPESILRISIIVLFVSFTFGMSVLNYLSYVKVRDLKIIYQTVIFDICIIAFCLYIANF